MFPKPTYQKVQKKKFPCLFERGFCWNCGIERYLEKHHIFGKANRPLSEQYGLYLDLCHSYTIQDGKKLVEVIGCHNKVTDELDKELIYRLKQEGQRRFEAQFGHEEFMRLFQRNYL
jgi:hypothetical protein